MATFQPTETQAEGEIDVDKAVKEILAEMEAEELDPLEGMGNAQIAEIYHRMTPEDQRLFRQFKSSIMRPTDMMPEPPVNSWHRTADVSWFAVRRC